LIKEAAMAEPIKISIIEDHPSIVDGYSYRLASDSRIKICGIARFGDEILPMLEANPTDVVLLDIELPTSSTNPNIFPILTILPLVKIKYPNLVILVISMHDQQVLIERLFELGVKGYIFKNDNDALQNHLGEIIVKVWNGGSYFSLGANAELSALTSTGSKPLLTSRQLEALSLCVAFPDCSSEELANHLGVSSSTFRNLLSNAYDRLGVRTRVAALAKLQKMGIGKTSYGGDF
jgi:DNA-binding NarL/FixJ family response regulator